MPLTVITTEMLLPILKTPIMILLALSAIFLIKISIEKVRFNSSSYGSISGNSFLKTWIDKGLYGEYLTVAKLEKMDYYKKIVVNPYIPKEDETTTEIDVVFISEYGIFVIESKNYSGWIYGSENNKNWTQTLGKEKHKFYNPILQNKGHIKELAKYLKFKEDKFNSIIVFSERCTLKKIEVNENVAKVIKRNDIAKTIRAYKIKILNIKDIEYAFEMIDSKARASVEIKTKHIAKIKARN